MTYSASSIKNALVKAGYNAYVTTNFDYSINKDKDFKVCFIRTDKADTTMWQIAEDYNARIEVACIISADNGKWVELKVMPKSPGDLEY